MFPEKEMCGLYCPNSTFMCMWAIYIFPRSVYLFCCENMWTDPGNIWIAQTHSCGKWGLGPRSSFSMNTQMGFSLQCTIWYDVPNSDICRGRKRPTVIYVLKFFCFIAKRKALREWYVKAFNKIGNMSCKMFWIWLLRTFLWREENGARHNFCWTIFPKILRIPVDHV